MGADLYRSGHQIIRDTARPTFDAAVKQRNQLFAQAEQAGTLVFPPNTILADPIAPPEAVAAQAAVHAAYEMMNPPSHYFRDSYNHSSLFGKLDLSWWGDLEAFLGPDGDGVMETKTVDGGSCKDYSLHPVGMRRLIARIEGQRLIFEANLREEDAETQDYFRDKCSRLTAFLHDAAEAGDTIYCSV